MSEGWVTHTCADLAEVESLLRQLAAKEREECRQRVASYPFMTYFRDCVVEQSRLAAGYRTALVTARAANDEHLGNAA